MQFPKKPNEETPNQEPQQQPPPPQQPWRNWLWPVLLLAIIIWTLFAAPDMFGGFGGAAVEIPYSFFYEQVQAGNVQSVVYEGEESLQGLFTSATRVPTTRGTADAIRFTVQLPPGSQEAVHNLLVGNNVEIESDPQEGSLLLALLINFGPILLLVAFFIWWSRRAQGQASNVFGFGRSQAREYNEERPKVTFEDVAGQDAAKRELEEIVDFLKDPDKYIALGARIPRGVLLVGPPGTGKTLMARAVAGEANVAFFSIAASEFVEMFVGVGASRVRDLFNRARKAAPSIVFIDEIDAVGRQRGAGLGGGHDEREQTLNQMLAEMDGFDQTSSVIVMAATNRPDVLDPALLRPGRFDRQVTVGLPDRNGRLHILKIHTRGKPIAEDVDLESLAKATVGFSGADIANLANEAALAAARHSRKRIEMSDFTEAFERIILGTERPPLSNEEERRVTAYHEAGHALVSLLTPKADPVLKVTIVPRGQALGITAYLPDDDRRNYSRDYIMAMIHTALGGRAAEEIAIGEITTGAENDLRRVTDLARRMVAQFGMSERIGPLNFGDSERQPFLGYSLAQPRNYSEETAAQIDEEVRHIVHNAYQHTLELIRNHRTALETLAQELLETEIVERDRLLEIARETIPSFSNGSAPDKASEALEGMLKAKRDNAEAASAGDEEDSATAKGNGSGEN